MTSLYFMSSEQLILLVISICILLIAQSLCLGSGLFIFRYSTGALLNTVLEAVILSYQFLLLVYAAEALYQVNEGFLIIHSYGNARVILFLMLLVVSFFLCLSEKSPLPLSVPVIASITLPGIEKAAGSRFSLLIILSLILWALRELNQLLICRKRLKEHLSEFSIKEAIDTMDFGILFCSAEKNSDGQVLLSNTKMQQLILSLTGEDLYNGRLFYKRLSDGNVLSCCRRDSMASQPVYRLGDGSVWRFELKYLDIKNKHCAMLLASDMTEQEKINSQLYEESKRLEQRNREISAMLKDLETICRTEETIRAKSQVHAVLGQKISLLLSSVREHREPDEALLCSLSSVFSDELKNYSYINGCSLEALVKNFESLGIAVHCSGTLPAEPRLRKTFYEIISEAMTNSVHHGYASEINIRISESGGCKELFITDNGISKNSITEGGGLRGIRLKVNEAGGEFSYCLKPHFSLSVKIPEEV